MLDVVVVVASENIPQIIFSIASELTLIIWIKIQVRFGYINLTVMGTVTDVSLFNHWVSFLKSKYCSFRKSKLE